MSDCVLLDNVASPLDRVRLSGQLAVAVASLTATTAALARVRAANHVSALLRQLIGDSAPTPAAAPVITLASKRRVKGDIMEGTHTELTLSNGKVVRIQRMDSTGSMGLPGWHDTDSDSLNSFLGDTEADAIRVVLERVNKATSRPLPVAEDAPADSGRAPAGGVVGMNGEFYKGGTFLPNTTLPKQGAQGSTAGSGQVLVEPGVYAIPPSDAAQSILARYGQFIHVTDGKATVFERPDAAIATYVNENVAEGRAFLSAAADAYNSGMRWFVPGDIQPGAEHYAEPAGTAPEIVEYTTRKGKTIRGVVRTDLTFTEAKAIDEYTFKYQGGWFIREKHLPGFEGDATKPPKPAPVALTPEQLAQAEADRQANADLAEQKRRQFVADKLRTGGATLVERAEQGLAADRKTNTARRASMAAGVMARLEADRATGLTMQNLAAAIESGEARHLAGITSRAAMETLQSSLRSAMSAAERNLSYAQQMQQRGRAPDENDIRHAKFPVAKWDSAGASRAQALEKIKGKRGAPALANTIRYGDDIAPETYRALVDMLGAKEADYLLGWWNVEQIARVGRLQRAGINNTQELQDALTEYLQFREGARKEDPIKKAERAIIGQKVGIDFFPTPAGLAMRMAQLANIRKGARVLEPSAGNGNLADAAKAEGGEVDVIEISSQLRTILEAKGYHVAGFDFDSFEPENKYDAIIMNPPFSNRKDADHIQRAHRMLKPGGTLVAIAGEGVFIGSDGKARQFRDWLDSQGAEVEPLEQGTFKDANLLATTGANARLIVLQK